MAEFSAEDREAICETFERLLSDKANEACLRKVIDTESGFDAELWKHMADLGLPGLMISSEYGGIDGGIEEVEAVMEVAGKYLFAGPFLTSCVIAPALLSASTDKSSVGPHLQNIAAGQSIFAVAGCGISGDWTAPTEVTALDGKLSGRAGFVAHARNADYCLVYADDGVYLVSMDAAGMRLKTHDADDKTLRVSTLTFDNVRAQKLEGVTREHRQKSLQLALIALAGEQVGATRCIFEMTLHYLNTRFQFGQPIGRFQALKHMAAELLLEVESASSAARHSARALAAGSPEATVLTYLAAFTCADNFRKIAADAIQLHGGIAYTVEHPAHLYWRRAQTGQWLFGSSDRFRDLYLSAMETVL